uniref:Acidic leucine-rich nuclear phosphoprotein 32 family member n=1 Tax=Eptatretus burgeri TaxID=7764 RepID=A0A8C4NMI9_EPTBU
MYYKHLNERPHRIVTRATMLSLLFDLIKSLFALFPASLQVMEVKKRIALELQSKKPAELSELVLDNCRAGEDGRLEGLTEELSGLRSLSLINMGLRTLEHLPRLPSLELLDLSDNRISNGLEFLAERTPKLTHLSLGGNRVKELCVLEVLKNLLQLQRLELMGCEVANLAGIRESVFEILPHLVYLDGADRLGALEPDSEDGDDDGDKCDEDDLDASESEVEDEEEEGEICEKDFLPDNEVCF